MRNLLALLGAAVLTFAVAGWYLGWYKLDPNPSRVTIEIDPKKVNADVHKGGQRVERAIQEASKEGAGKGTQSIAAPIKVTP